MWHILQHFCYLKGTFLPILLILFMLARFLETRNKPGIIDILICIRLNYKPSHYLLGFKSKEKIPIFPSNRVLREGTSATFCCVPRIGVNITGMAFRNNPYPLINIGAGVKAISVHNLTIPTTFFKQLLFGCKDSTGRNNHTWNYVSGEFESWWAQAPNGAKALLKP